MKTDAFFGVIAKSRLVIQEFATSVRNDVFTVTKPLVACRLVLNLATSRLQKRPPWSRRLEQEAAPAS